MSSRVEPVQHALDLEENIALHRKGWRVQPIGKAFILLIIIAGVLGLFGEGLLGNQTVRQGNAQVQYEKYGRQDGKMKLQIAATGVRGRSAISFPISYIKNFQVERIVPEPQSSFVREGQVWYVFEATQNLQAHFYLQPETRGAVSGSVWVNEQEVPLHHFIFP